MTDDNRISSNRLQGVFFANLCSNMFAGNASEESLNVAKEAAEKLMEQQIDGLAITEGEAERSKRERKTENEAE